MFELGLKDVRIYGMLIANKNAIKMPLESGSFNPKTFMVFFIRITNLHESDLSAVLAVKDWMAPNFVN